MATTPNKRYNNQVTGTDSGTWGIILNQNFTAIDNNLGGTLSLSVAGSADVTLTTAQSQNLIYNFTGILTANINVIFPAAGGLYFINNATTGAFTLTIQAGSSTAGFLVPQGTQSPIYVDNSSSPPTVGGAAGTQYVFTGGVVGGTANALTLSQTFPTNFTLETGTFLTIIPTANNTGAATLVVNGGSPIAINKVGASGLIPVQGGDIFAGVPAILQYNGSVWIYLNLVYAATPTRIGMSFALSFANWLEPIIATAPITITIPEVATNLTYYFNFPVTAGGGAVTWTPFATDVIWVNGVALSAGVGYIQPAGSISQMTTDANGNIYLAVSNPNLSSSYTGAQFGGTASAGNSTTRLATTAFVNGTALTLANGTTAVTQASTDNSTKPATTAFIKNLPQITAYLNYNPSTTTINNSLNVTSVTKNSTGNYTINFTNAYVDTNYIAIFITSGTAPAQSNQVQIVSQSTGNINIFITASTSGGAIDTGILNMIIVGS